MAAPTLHRAEADRDALLPMFAVRAELEANADTATLEAFGHAVQRGIQAAAETGTVAPVNEVLRTWLRIAFVAQDSATHIRLSPAEREQRLARLMEHWLQANGDQS